MNIIIDEYSHIPDQAHWAQVFASIAHGGQKRKYTGVRYTVHTDEVAEIVARVTDDQEMIAAAHLHDTVEDTKATLEDIQREFGDRVASLVENLTDVSKPEDGNRDARRALDREHTAKAHPDAKTIKLADIISNSKDILVNDPKFAKVYLAEMRLLLPHLAEGNSALFERASELIMDNRE